MLNTPKIEQELLTLNKKIQYNVRVNLETEGRN